MPFDLENLLVETVETMRSRFYGKYRGLVTDVEDPLKMGRVMARVPEVFEDVQTPWAVPCVPFAGSRHGFVVLPEVGDGVWIEFEAGDISRPIWTGCWWGEGELPDPGGTQTRVLVTTLGHKLILDDLKKEIRLLHYADGEMVMKDDDITLTIGDSETKMTRDEITVKVKQSVITVNANEIILESGAGKIKLSLAGVDVNNGAVKVT